MARRSCLWRIILCGKQGGSMKRSKTTTSLPCALIGRSKRPVCLDLVAQLQSNSSKARRSWQQESASSQLLWPHSMRSIGNQSVYRPQCGRVKPTSVVATSATTFVIESCKRASLSVSIFAHWTQRLQEVVALTLLPYKHFDRRRAIKVGSKWKTSKRVEADKATVAQ